MKLALHEIDEQIREVENRMAVERIALQDAMQSCKASLRETVTSPKTLLTIAGVGFTVGKVLFRDKKSQPQNTAPAKKAGMIGMLTGVAGTAISLAGSRWGGVARWAAARYFARRKAAQAAAHAGPASAAATVRRATPPVRPPSTSATRTRTPAGV
jgi:hypothetical protein